MHIRSYTNVKLNRPKDRTEHKMRNAHKPKDVDEMNFKELAEYIGVTPASKKALKPKFRKMSATRMIREARASFEKKSQF